MLQIVSNCVGGAWVGSAAESQPGGGEGVSWGVETSWPWPPWATLLFAAVAVGVVVALYLRQSGKASRARRLALATIRLTLVAIAALMIAQIALTKQVTAPPELVVLVDDSLSMTIVDRIDRPERSSQSDASNAESTRWDLLRALLSARDGELLRQMAETHRLRVVFLSGKDKSGPGIENIVAEVEAAEPQGAGTRLGEAILAAVDASVKPAAIVALTDGINTDGPSLAEAAERARLRGAPLWFIGVGGDRPLGDLKLSNLTVDEVVFRGDMVNFECTLSSVGFDGRAATVVLREKGSPKTLAKVDVAVADERPVRVLIPFRPDRVGCFEYVVEALSPGKELSEENNRQSRTVEVREEKIRVLLIAGRPDFEFRYLRNLLERDESMLLHTILQDADPEYAEQDAAALGDFPRRDELFDYDVAIVGDADPAMLGADALRGLAEFVDRPSKGGSIVFIAGTRYMPTAYCNTPLERLMPFDARRIVRTDGGDVATEGFVARPTDLGLAFPSMQLGDDLAETKRIWAALPRLYWLLDLPEAKTDSRVLLENPSQTGRDGRPLPVALLRYVGAGKVLFHATDETWRWRYRGNERYYARYWKQTVRWLSRAKLAEADDKVALTTDRREYEQGESVWLRANFVDERLAPAEDDGVTAAIELPDGGTERIVLRRTSNRRGAFQAALDRPAPGAYRAWIVVPELKTGRPAVEFTVSPPATEFARTRMDAVAMRRVAELSGGRFFDLESADRLASLLPPGRRTPVATLPPTPFWNRWPVLTLFLGLLVVEWGLRKRCGMV